MTAQAPPIVIPPGATAVIVLEQFSHLDWDWLNTFATNVDGSNPIDDGYFGAYYGMCQPSNVIYTQAHDLLMLSGDYWYATCEIGFLQAFGEAYPALLSDMISSGRLRIVGGGITSPDNLLSNGECFFRNYIVGLQWMQTVSLPWTRCVWLPDDFGHDSQLPATLAAMDALAVGFARCPMAPAYQGKMTYQQPAPQAGTILPTEASANGGCDFFWTAADGSQIFAHWMPSAYSQGTTLYEPSFGPNWNLIGTFLTPNQTCSPTPYIHVPVANDFVVPVGGGPAGTKVTNALLEDIASWSQANPATPAVLSTFDQYVASVLLYLDANPGTTIHTRSFHGETTDPDATTFRSNPYWMGFYASRMNIKALHEQATRMLLAAETLDALLASVGAPVPNATQDLLAAWAELVPSTHHDYITGTAADGVVAVEQMPRLASSISLATNLMNSQMAALAAVFDPSAPLLLVFNPLGFAVAGALVEIDAALAKSINFPQYQSQVAADGNVIVYVDAPSAGYKLFFQSFPAPPPAPTVTPDGSNPTSYTLANGVISVTIAQSANWSITNVTDVAAGTTMLSSGNTLSFFSDNGNIYEFGYECQNDASFTLLSPAISAGAATVTESGPLRVTVSAPITVTLPWQQTQTYTLAYSLVAGAPYVEMTLIGQAPDNTSMFVNFTFGESIEMIEHGTPAHWDYKAPATFGSQTFNSVVEPTHDWVMAFTSQSLLGAIYHQAVPGWAMSGNTLMGAVLRNTPSGGCDGRGAQGGDSVQHTITYALRVPTGLANNVAALREARAYNTPLYATVATPSSAPAPPPAEYSLASVNEPSILTTVKRGTFDPSALFVRVYQPTNQPAEVTVTVAADTTNAAIATALEQVPTNAGPAVTTGTGEVSFTTQSAITTIAIPGFAP